jgi:hypothetical protein
MEREEFIKNEYSIINSNEVSMDEDDQDFIDNYSWDTKSENDQDLVDYIEDIGDKDIIKYYNNQMHVWLKTYKSENYQELKEVVEAYNTLHGIKKNEDDDDFLINKIKIPCKYCSDKICLCKMLKVPDNKVNQSQRGPEDEDDDDDDDDESIFSYEYEMKEYNDYLDHLDAYQ